MLDVFESEFNTKSNRVKGLSFHPKRPWLLASLHNGAIQLWDYRMGTLIHTFEEHEGRFGGSPSTPPRKSFAPGATTVWNVKTRRCLFTLTGHADYIRTVAFHHELPWILSASDDHTLRIWNWQARTCLATLTGHNHYVMCAKFHPSKDLIASACLDLTIRVWDFSQLRQKTSKPESTRSPEDDLRRIMSGTVDTFGNPEILVKYIIEGHTKGVNWVDFHPTLPLLVSGGDDRQVKLWRMNDQRYWEVDTCRGHYNNVSSVIFHPRQELILSNSEDRSIRVWDATKRTLLQTFRRDADRYWVMAAHPHLNLMAAGHDSGLLVFKLQRERPAMHVSPNTLVYVRDNHVRVHNFSTGSDQPLHALRKPANAGQYFPPPRSLTFNPVDKAVIVSSVSDGGAHFELFRGGARSDDAAPSLKGTGHCAVFISRNRFVALDRENDQLDVRDLDAKSVKVIKLSSPVEAIHAAPGGNLVLVDYKAAILYDVAVKKELGSISLAGVRHVVWSPDHSQAALLCKYSITIVDNQLTQLAHAQETVRVKSAAWDPCGVLIYTTLNHIKFMLPQGDKGIICTLDQPIYLTHVKGQKVHYLDREAKPQIAVIDPAEYRFKLALLKHDYDQVIHAIRNSNLVGQSIIAYLRKKGYAEIALHFIKDEQTRFDLALESGNLEVALASAKGLNVEACWKSLAQHALQQGNLQVVATCHQQLSQFDRLAFVYFRIGDAEKLAKMQMIAQKREDPQSLFQTSIYTGDAASRVKALQSAGQDALAYLTAKCAGLDEVAQTIVDRSNVSSNVLAELPVAGAPLQPPKPVSIAADANWPRLNVSKGMFERFLASLEHGPLGGSALVDEDMDEAMDGGWGDLDVQDGPQETSAEEEDAGWGVDDDLKIDEAIGAELVNSAQSAEFVMPQRGASNLGQWARNSPWLLTTWLLSAMQLLHRQLGVVNFVPLKPHFLNILSASQAYLPGISGLPSMTSGLRRNHETNDARPIQPFELATAVAALKEGYRQFKANLIDEAQQQFTKTLQLVPLLIVASQQEQEEVQQLVGICREYAIGLQMEQLRRKLPADQTKRSLELAAYFTHCDLDPQHLIITMRSAMASAFSAKNFITAATFARRLLELGPAQALASRARNVQTVSERTPTDAVALDYDQYNPFVVCAGSFTPIYAGSPSVTCPLCKAHYLPTYESQVCKVCQVSQINAQATGLRNL
ncbi:hypothetical protein L0F63_007459 [Massospora cicadina]|nr:hypothetical protein L0F63_007459 [Massospora cicadina]